MKLYHRTKREFVASILRYGLITSSLGIVYLSPITNAGFGDTLLEVETREIRLTAFEDCREWEVLCWGQIPPQDIKVSKFEG